MRNQGDVSVDEWIATEKAIKEALAQPEQEPVGEIVDAIEGAFKCSFTKMLPVGTKLYTTPPQRTWVGLTDEEIEHAFKTNSVMVDNGNAYMVAGLRAVNIAQAIEAKLKEKNT
jgi:hypothetical protein